MFGDCFFFFCFFVAYMIVKKREGKRDAAKGLRNTFSSENIAKYKTSKQ